MFFQCDFPIRSEQDVTQQMWHDGSVTRRGLQNFLPPRQDNRDVLSVPTLPKRRTDTSVGSSPANTALKSSSTTKYTRKTRQQEKATGKSQILNLKQATYNPEYNETQGQEGTH